MKIDSHLSFQRRLESIRKGWGEIWTPIYRDDMVVVFSYFVVFMTIDIRILNFPLSHEERGP